MNYISEISAAIQAVAGVLSVIVAVFAITTSMKFAAINVRPLLSIETMDYENVKAVMLVNHGVGTAVITHISFSKIGGASSNNLAQLMYPDKTIMWDDFSYFNQKREFVRPGHKINLAKLSEAGLIASNVSKDKIQEIFQEWQKELAGIEVQIHYQDVLGNKQESYERLFS